MRVEERNESTMTYFRYSFINYFHLQVNLWEKKEKEKKKKIERSDFDYKWH